RAIAGDLAAADLLLERDALVGDDALLRNARALGRFACRNLGLFEIARTFDFEPPVLFLLRDARHAHREFLRDARFFGFLARGDFGILDIALPLALAPLIVRLP